ncbi:hypothetical protein BGX34_002104 [Mortierella sp. NVP85]|nr:hypothetical protein BGX34_002104 [Mortierella sp. NVP85]
MSLRLVSSAKNLREQFKSNGITSTLAASNASSAAGSPTLDTGLHSPSLPSRQGTILRTSSSHGALRRAKSPPKRTFISKVFTDETGQSDALPDLSMEMTLVIVRRCVKEIRLTTKGILRPIQMGHNQKVVMDTIRLILDDDTETQLSPLHQVNIHLVADAMKWAIRYSEETLVTYDEYQTSYLNQDRSFSRLVNSLPPINRQILLDLFSLCADVTLLAHLNNMTLVSVAKAISLSIMAEPEREFTTFDASLQQRNLWGAACEDLLRAFLRIKTTHDLAKIEQEDDIDENRYFDNVTRQVKSARQRNHEISMQHSPMLSAPLHLPSSSLSRSGSGYFDHIPTPRSASPLSQQTISRSASVAPSTTSRSRPISPSPSGLEYEEIMQDRSYLDQLSLHPQPFAGGRERRRSSVADMESLYMLPVEDSTDGGYESEPEPARASLMPDFVDNLGWDLSKLDSLHEDDLSPKLHRSNSSGKASNGGGERDKALRQLVSAPIYGVPYGSNEVDSQNPSPYGTVQRSSTANNARVGHAISPGHTTAAVSPQRAKRSSILRRSMSLDPHTMHGRVHKKPNELRQGILARELAIQAERSQVAEDIRSRLLSTKQSEAVEGSPTSSSSSSPRSTLLEPPQDLERPPIPVRGASQGLGRSMSKSTNKDAKLEVDVGGPSSKQSSTGAAEEPTISSSSVTPPKPQQEVSVFFTPISPASPKSELRSKFQESFMDKPIAPPHGYTHSQSSGSSHKRSASNKSNQSSRMSPSSSTVPSPMQSKSVSRSNSRGQSSGKTLGMPPLQQSASFSGLSTASSTSGDAKSKAAGFIRALSFKLRSKQSDEQLKPSKINNQAVNVPPVPSSVSFQPPRLELSFLGDSGASSSSAPNSLPPVSAPAALHHSNDSTASSESWKNASQDSLSIPAGAGSDKPKDFTGARRSSGASSNVALREQRRRSRLPGTSVRFSSNHQASGAKADGKRNSGLSSSVRSPNRPLKERTLSDSSYTSDDSGTLYESTADDNDKGDPAKATSPAKAGEREYRFSTATLLKDGKLYYQLQWENFSESGFASDFFSEPEQYLTGLSQKRMSKMVGSGGGPVMNPSVMAGPQTNSTILQDHTTLALGGHVGQDLARFPDSGPSPAQRAAAMKAARQSFMALAKDPKALAALKAGSTGGIGQATIIGTGSFPIGSAQPVLDPQPLNLNWDAVSTTGSTSGSNSGQTSQSSKGDDAKLPKNTSDMSSSTLSTVGVASSGSKREIVKPGKVSTTVGGAGSSSSSPLARSPLAEGKDLRAPVSNSAMPPVKPPKKSRLFGVKLKGSKKTNRLSTSAGTLSVAMAHGNLSNTNLGKKKQQQRIPAGLVRKDLLTKTEEAVDEYFPWTCIEHMAGQDSGWVMLEPVQDGAVGWVKIDRLEEEIARLAEAEKQQAQELQRKLESMQQQEQLPKQVEFVFQQDEQVEYEQDEEQQLQVMEREP